MDEACENSREAVDAPCERAYLVTLRTAPLTRREAELHLRELESLVGTMGLEITGSEIIPLRELHPRYLLGQGKTAMLLETAKASGADVLIFDDDLTPSQQRNLEKLGGITVIDRQEVILDIFAARASTREAVLQVALARMEYSLPRLTRAWTHLSRQRGGAKGTRGEGETQLEVDRRLVLKKIIHLKQELEKVRLHRASQRKRRLAKPVPTAAIVGYTNAGKSTLLNALTNAAVLTEDKLFATLDPTTRRVKITSRQEILLTDTVGFIRKLPHNLVDAFKSTLEETVLADFLIHVVDIADPEADEHQRTTLRVLDEIGAAGKPVLTVYNKLDRLENREDCRLQDPRCIAVSLKEGTGIPALLEAIAAMATRGMTMGTYRLPLHEQGLLALVRETGMILEEKYTEEGITLQARVPEKTLARIREYAL